MTINSPAAVIWAMYLAVAEKQGADWKTLSGTLQNDILKEYIAQKEYIYPPEPSMRLVIDTIEFGAKRTPKFNPISISGYHIREAGSTAIQELGVHAARRHRVRRARHPARPGRGRFRAAAFVFLQRAQRFFRGDRQISRRAAHLVHARCASGSARSDPRSWALRFHAQTAGCSLTAQQPYNNVVRTALQALAAVLGGTQSLHTNSLDEAWALPTEFAATLGAAHAADHRVRKRRQRTRPTRSAAPILSKSLTNEVERGAEEYIEKIDALGGMVAAIERGYPQREIAEAAYALSAGRGPQGENHRRRE